MAEPKKGIISIDKHYVLVFNSYVVAIAINE